MRTVFSYAKPYKWPILIALTLMLVELTLELIQPLLIAKIIDDGILQHDLSVVTGWGAVMLAFSFVAFFAGIINSYFAAHAAQGFSYDLRGAVFEKIQALTLSAFLRFPTSSLVTRLTSDVTMVQTVLFMGLRIMLRAPLLVLGSLVMAFYVQPSLAIYLVAGAPFLLLFLWLITKKGIQSFGQIQRQLDRVNRIIQENLQAVRLIKSYLRGAYEASRFAKVAQALKEDTVGTLRMMELVMPVLLVIMNGSLLAILWFGAEQIQNETVQVGQVVAIVNYAMRMTGAFSMFAFLIMIFSRAQASATRIEEVLQVEDSEAILPTGIEKKLHGSLKFEKVSFRYPKAAEEVLKSISFEVKSGEKLAIMGATGSGKTTLFTLIPRLFTPTSGRILLDGEPLEDWSLQYVRQQIGYVSQRATLFTGTIAFNIAWGNPEATAQQIEQAAQQAQIATTIDQFPMQYETRVGQKGVNLSGGQKQRLAIARALVRQPRILLLDDSTSALDVQTEEALWQALNQQSMTMLVITQKIQTAQTADQVLLLDDGHVVGYGTHKELLASSALYQRIAQSQQEVEKDGF